jgi:hypothetical protein
MAYGRKKMRQLQKSEQQRRRPHSRNVNKRLKIGSKK